ncbi:manganese transport protein [Escherichia coli]|uniref:Manganese transport protein n=1 Tax=Escherichia coli TaxID=562 RepID=A0A376KQM5_ECOLX|nr:manganese transport protein [Escherichia coli]
MFVAAAYIVELIFSQPNLAQLGKGMVIPSLPTSEAVFLAAGVLGATIMPHVIYLHSSLTQHLHGGSRQQRYSATKWDVAIAMTIAGFVQSGDDGYSCGGVPLFWSYCVADLDEAYLTLQPLLSHAAATVFGLSLVAAGLSSTVVGTLAGQVVMQGFIRFHIPLWVRRTVTMLPSFIVILMGLDPTRILVMSQVLLSFGIALALVPLLIFTSDSKLMGDLVNSKRVKQTGWVIVVLVVALNIWLLVGTALGL